MNDVHCRFTMDEQIGMSLRDSRAAQALDDDEEAGGPSTSASSSLLCIRRTLPHLS